MQQHPTDRSAMSPWSATAVRARPPWPRRCSSCRRHHEAGGSTTARPPRPRPEEVARRMSISLASPRSSGSRERRHVQGQPDRHARLPRLRRRGDAAVSVADLAVFVVSAVEGVEVQTEMLWRRARRSACRGWSSSTRRTRTAPTSTPSSTSSGRSSAAASPRSSCRSARPRRCTASSTCSPRRRSSTSPAARTTTSRCPPTWPTRSTPARPDRRGDRLRRRRAARALPLRRRPDGRRSRAHARPRGARLHRVPGAPRVGVTGVGVDRLADFICELGPSPADRPVDRRRRRHDRRRSPPMPAASRSPTCSRRSPTRSSASSRCSRCSPARSAPTTTCSTAHRRARSGCTACSPARQGADRR